MTGVVLADGRAIAAGLVVGADGRRSLVARVTGAADRERHPGVRALYYQYVEGMPGPSGAAPDGPEFSGLGDELAYVFPSDAGLSCVAISVNLDEYERLRHDVQEGFRRLLAASPRPVGPLRGEPPAGPGARLRPDARLRAAGGGGGLGTCRRRRHAPGPVDRARDGLGRHRGRGPRRHLRRARRLGQLGGRLRSAAATSSSSTGSTRPSQVLPICPTAGLTSCHCRALRLRQRATRLDRASAGGD